MHVRAHTLYRVPVYCAVAGWLSFQATVHLGRFFLVVTPAKETTQIAVDPVRSAILQGALFVLVLLLGGAVGLPPHDAGGNCGFQQHCVGALPDRRVLAAVCAGDNGSGERSCRHASKLAGLSGLFSDAVHRAGGFFCRGCFFCPFTLYSVWAQEYAVAQSAAGGSQTITGLVVKSCPDARISGEWHPSAHRSCARTSSAKSGCVRSKSAVLTTRGMRLAT